MREHNAKDFAQPDDVPEAQFCTHCGVPVTYAKKVWRTQRYLDTGNTHRGYAIWRPFCSETHAEAEREARQKSAELANRLAREGA